MLKVFIIVFRPDLMRPTIETGKIRNTCKYTIKRTVIVKSKNVAFNFKLEENQVSVFNMTIHKLRSEKYNYLPLRVHLIECCTKHPKHNLLSLHHSYKIHIKHSNLYLHLYFNKRKKPWV